VRYILATLLLTSCAASTPTVDAELQPYVDNFAAWLDSHCIERRYISAIVFTPRLVPPNIGYCMEYGPFNSSLRYIHINREFWDKVEEPKRKALIFHELAHCYTGIDHYEYGLMTEWMYNYDDNTLNIHLYMLVHQLDDAGLVGCWPPKSH
jgi:hypothetical protein